MAWPSTRGMLETKLCSLYDGPLEEAMVGAADNQPPGGGRCDRQDFLLLASQFLGPMGDGTPGPPMEAGLLDGFMTTDFDGAPRPGSPPLFGTLSPGLPLDGTGLGCFGANDGGFGRDSPWLSAVIEAAEGGGGSFCDDGHAGEGERLSAAAAGRGGDAPPLPPTSPPLPVGRPPPFPLPDIATLAPLLKRAISAFVTGRRVALEQQQPSAGLLVMLWLPVRDPASGAVLLQTRGLPYMISGTGDEVSNNAGSYNGRGAPRKAGRDAPQVHPPPLERLLLLLLLLLLPSAVSRRRHTPSPFYGSPPFHSSPARRGRVAR